MNSLPFTAHFARQNLTIPPMLRPVLALMFLTAIVHQLTTATPEFCRPSTDLAFIDVNVHRVTLLRQMTQFLVALSFLESEPFRVGYFAADTCVAAEFSQVLRRDLSPTIDSFCVNYFAADTCVAARFIEVLRRDLSSSMKRIYYGSSKALFQEGKSVIVVDVV